ncbi:MAG: hypothetical protein M5U16_01215 [Hyphomicrobium sp.]|nr:hypothetical protein [Hyphomicrobium sp.]
MLRVKAVTDSPVTQFRAMQIHEVAHAILEADDLPAFGGGVRAVEEALALGDDGHGLLEFGLELLGGHSTPPMSRSSLSKVSI